MLPLLVFAQWLPGADRGSKAEVGKLKPLAVGSRNDALKSPVTAARTSGSMGREDETREVSCVSGGFRVRSRVPYDAEGAWRGRASLSLLTCEEGVARTIRAAAGRDAGESGTRTSGGVLTIRSETRASGKLSGGNSLALSKSRSQTPSQSQT